MANDKKHHKNKGISGNFTDADDSETGTGGASGEIQFHDFLASDATLRDDLLPDEKKRLLSVHNDGNAQRVQEQKKLRSQREDVKNGKIPLQTYRQGQGNGMQGEFEAHPIFANSPRFHDPKVETLPSENTADTNPELRNELQNRLRHSLRHAPAFNPRLTR